MLALGIVAAVGASLLYNTSIALQALEAREVPGEHALRPSLIGRLLRNRRWLGATALGLLGWPLEIAALLLAPLTVVQPCLASGLILLLWLGATRLGEAPGAARVRRRRGDRRRRRRGRLGGAGADAPTTPGTAAIALALALVAIPIALPYLLRGRARGGRHRSPSSAPAAATPGPRSPASCSPTSSPPGRCSSRPPGWRPRPPPRAWRCSAR